MFLEHLHLIFELIDMESIFFGDGGECLMFVLMREKLTP